MGATGNGRGHSASLVHTVKLTVVVKDVDELQVVALAGHEVVGVVGGGDLHGTCEDGGRTLEGVNL